jgi:hypothetical protein
MPVSTSSSAWSRSGPLADDLTVYAVRHGNYEPPEVLALYLFESEAQLHADDEEYGEVVPMTVKVRYEKEAS